MDPLLLSAIGFGLLGMSGLAVSICRATRIQPALSDFDAGLLLNELDNDECMTCGIVRPTVEMREVHHHCEASDCYVVIGYRCVTPCRPETEPKSA
jgi:hypothetical protein